MGDHGFEHLGPRVVAIKNYPATAKLIESAADLSTTACTHSHSQSWFENTGGHQNHHIEYPGAVYKFIAPPSDVAAAENALQINTGIADLLRSEQWKSFRCALVRVQPIPTRPAAYLVAPLERYHDPRIPLYEELKAIFSDQIRAVVPDEGEQLKSHFPYTEEGDTVSYLVRTRFAQGPLRRHEIELGAVPGELPDIILLHNPGRALRPRSPAPVSQNQRAMISDNLSYRPLSPKTMAEHPSQMSLVYQTQDSHRWSLTYNIYPILPPAPHLPPDDQDHHLVVSRADRDIHQSTISWSNHLMDFLEIQNALNAGLSAERAFRSTGNGWWATPQGGHQSNVKAGASQPSLHAQMFRGQLPIEAWKFKRAAQVGEVTVSTLDEANLGSAIRISAPREESAAACELAGLVLDAIGAKKNASNWMIAPSNHGLQINLFVIERRRQEVPAEFIKWPSEMGAFEMGGIGVVSEPFRPGAATNVFDIYVQNRRSLTEQTSKVAKMVDQVTGTHRQAFLAKCWFHLLAAEKRLIRNAELEMPSDSHWAGLGDVLIVPLKDDALRLKNCLKRAAGTTDSYPLREAIEIAATLSAHYRSLGEGSRVLLTPGLALYRDTVTRFT